MVVTCGPAVGTLGRLRQQQIGKTMYEPYKPPETKRKIKPVPDNVKHLFDLMDNCPCGHKFDVPPIAGFKLETIMVRIGNWNRKNKSKFGVKEVAENSFIVYRKS